MQIGLVTFWYMCDAVISTDQLHYSVCREAILDAIGECNNLAVAGNSEIKSSFQIQLSAMFGALYSSILIDMTKECMTLPDDETNHFKAYMWYLGSGISNVGSNSQMSLTNINHQLGYWTLNILGKLNVNICPTAKVLKLLLTFGASLVSKDGQKRVPYTIP